MVDWQAKFRQMAEIVGWLIILVLMNGCNYLNTNGKSGDDGLAALLGLIGVLMFLAGVFSEKKSAMLAIAGALFILA